MKNIVLNNWRLVMDNRFNPLRHLPMPAQHYFMQALAWMWSMIFSLSFLSIYHFHLVWVAHVLLIAGVFLTVSVFAYSDNKKQSGLKHKRS